MYCCNDMYITCSNVLSFSPSLSLCRGSEQFIFLLSLSHLLEHYRLHEKKNKEKDTEGEGGVSADDIIQLILDESDPVSWTVLSPIKDNINLPLITTEG